MTVDIVSVALLFPDFPASQECVCVCGGVPGLYGSSLGQEGLYPGPVCTGLRGATAELPLSRRAVREA